MQMDANQKITFIGLIIAIVIGSGYYFYNNHITPAPPKTPLNERQNSVLIVHVSGAVMNEGVYRLERGARICDAVKLAGGSSSGADFSSVNLAEMVKDGQKIEIPSRRKAEAGLNIGAAAAVGPIARGSGARINVNRASVEQLVELPGIGKVTAQKIVAARPFRSIDDFAKTARMGKSRLDRIRNRVSL